MFQTLTVIQTITLLGLLFLYPGRTHAQEAERSHTSESAPAAGNMAAAEKAHTAEITLVDEEAAAAEETLAGDEIAEPERSGQSYLENHSIALSLTVSYWRELFRDGGVGFHIPLADEWELGINFGYENLNSSSDLIFFLSEPVGGVFNPGTVIAPVIDINRYLGVSSDFGTYVGASIFTVFWIPGEPSAREAFESMTLNRAVVGGSLLAAVCWFPHDRIKLAGEYYFRYRRSTLSENRTAQGIDSIVLMKLSFKPF